MGGLRAMIPGISGTSFDKRDGGGRGKRIRAVIISLITLVLCAYGSTLHEFGSV